MGKTITDEQFAARELVRDWAAGSGAVVAVRDIEQGEPKAWRPVFARLAELGLCGAGVRLPLLELAPGPARARLRDTLSSLAGIATP